MLLLILFCTVLCCHAIIMNNTLPPLRPKTQPSALGRPPSQSTFDARYASAEESRELRDRIDRLEQFVITNVGLQTDTSSQPLRSIAEIPQEGLSPVSYSPTTPRTTEAHGDHTLKKE
ncbi:hypothetical protein F5Y16DRAFT_253460 [Xylariaceae sp. FL0255]|nr:hypothetical protein F5Y16DRAFT_253460 [Xylariaceae sp. FL0255]